MIVHSTQESALLPMAPVKVESPSTNSFLGALAAASQKRVGDQPSAATGGNAAHAGQGTSKAQTEHQELIKYLNDYLRKGPMQILREKILKAMGLTEESVKNLPPEQQAKIEAAIAKKIREYMEAHNGVPRQAAVDQSVVKLI